MYVKPDAALLVNRKPFFLPHFSEEIEAHLCMVAKISRMGRCIEARFAERYYEETAPACNFMMHGLEKGTGLDGLTKGIAFDNSLAVGRFVRAGEMKAVWAVDNKETETGDLITSMNEAVAEVSRYITLRTGDMVAVDYSCEPVMLRREMVISASNDTEDTAELLYCKIK